jgi:hypothetical protein
MASILAVTVHAASIQGHDGDLRVSAVLHGLRSQFRRLKVIFSDSAQARNDLPARVRASFKRILQSILRPVGLKGFVVLPKLWIEERTFG